MSEYRIMAHMIPYYPDLESSFAVVQGILDGGARYLEIQIPFTDPSADGPVIEAACQIALKQGSTVDGYFAFVDRCAREIQARKTLGVTLNPDGCDIFVMSYASPVIARGVERFAADAAAAGAKGLIVPDLPVDDDEGLGAACVKNGLAFVPVVVPFIRKERLESIVARKLPYIYCALRSGTTGNKTELTSEVRAFLKNSAAGGAKILGGFGLVEGSQVVTLAPDVHAAIVGSQIVRTTTRLHEAKAGTQELREGVAGFVHSLVNPGS